MKLTIGFIGLGNIIERHIGTVAAMPEFDLVAVCDRDEEKLKRRTTELGCKGFTQYRHLLDDGPDVVLIALPHGLHCDATVAALNAGCHVLVEKPMAVSVDECNRMLATAAECGKQLIVTEYASFQPGALLTGEKFRTGRLGRFFTGSIVNERFYFKKERPRWFLDPVMSGGGMFSNVGLHRLAVARACLPGLTPVSVTGSVAYLPKYKIEACTSAMVKYREGGAMLYEEVGYYPKPEWLNVGLHFVFEQGIVMWTSDTWGIMTRSGKVFQEPLQAQVPLYTPSYTNLLKAIRNEAYCPKTWEHATDTAIAQAAYASAREGHQITLTRPPWVITAPRSQDTQ